MSGVRLFGFDAVTCKDHTWTTEGRPTRETAYHLGRLIRKTHGEKYKLVCWEDASKPFLCISSYSYLDWWRAVDVNIFSPDTWLPDVKSINDWLRQTNIRPPFDFEPSHWRGVPPDFVHGYWGVERPDVGAIAVASPLPGPRRDPILRVEAHMPASDKASVEDTWKAVLAVCGDRRAS